MAKQPKPKLPKGRSIKKVSASVKGKAKTNRYTPIEQKTQVSRSVKAGAGTKRGNRRDMHPVYSTGKTKSVGGQRGPSGRSTRKGGPNSAALSK